MIFKQFFSNVVSTHLWNTPRATFTNRGCKGIPFIVGERGIAWGVLYGCVVILLDLQAQAVFFLSFFEKTPFLKQTKGDWTFFVSRNGLYLDVPGSW